MEPNDKKVDEPIVEDDKIIEEEVVLDDETDDTPTLEDFQALQKKAKTLEAQKAHWKKKAEQVKPNGNIENKPELKKETNKNESLSSDDVISLATIVASGVHPDVLKEARELARFKGISIKDALELPTVRAYAEEIKRTTLKEKAQLGASGGNPVYQDFKKPLTPAEHRKLWEKSNK